MKVKMVTWFWLAPTKQLTVGSCMFAFADLADHAHIVNCCSFLTITIRLRYQRLP